MRILKSIDLFSTLVLVAVLITLMYVNGFTWLVLVAIILQSIWSLILLGDILRSPIHLKDPLNNYPIGSLVEVTGHKGETKHYLNVGSVYPVTGHNEGYQVVLGSTEEGEQLLDLCNIKIFQKV